MAVYRAFLSSGALLMVLAAPLGAQESSAGNRSRPATEQRFEKLVRQVGDTIFMAKPKILRYRGPMQVPREATPLSPDTIKILLLGDSAAVTLNVTPVYHYAGEDLKRLRFLIALQALLPDPPRPDSVPRHR